jgi:hypothetical protein
MEKADRTARSVRTAGEDFSERKEPRPDRAVLMNAGSRNSKQQATDPDHG